MIGRYGNLNIYRELVCSFSFFRFMLAVLLIPASFAVNRLSLPAVLFPYLEITPGTLFLLVSAGLNGFPIITGAARGILEKRINVDELVSIAIVACIITGELFEAATVAAIMVFGSLIEEVVSDSARSSIKKLVELTPDTVVAYMDGREIAIPVKDVKQGDILITRPGETVAVDAEIIAGSASIDESSVTGESLPVSKHPGDVLSAGTVNLDGFIKLKAIRVWEDSTFNKIISLVKSAENSKVKSAGIVDRYASWFTPVILSISVIVFIITRDVTSAITVLIVGCPCSFLLSGPLPTVAAIANAARSGIMIKGGEYLEKAAYAGAVFLDKTGTLTEGSPEVKRIIPGEGFTEKDVLRYALSVEKGSEHPLSKAIIKKAASENIDVPTAADIKVFPGTGISGVFEGKNIFVGSPREDNGSRYTVASVIVGRNQAGVIEFSDTLRGKARVAVSCLKEMGIDNVCILSGDGEVPVAETARDVCIDSYRCRLTPEEKFHILKEFNKGSIYSVFVGDGLNDAPALKVAHVGIAMGEKGTDAALETADIVLMNNRIENIPFIIRLGKRMIAVIKTNIGISLAINAMALIAASLGELTPVWGAVTHNIGSVLVLTLSSTVGLVKNKEAVNG